MDQAIKESSTIVIAFEELMQLKMIFVDRYFWLYDLFTDQRA